MPDLIHPNDQGYKIWAESMEQKGMPGKKVLQGYLDGLRQRGTVLVRDWDK